MRVSARIFAPDSPRRSSYRWISRLWLISILTFGLYSVPTEAQSAAVVVGSGSSVPTPLFNRWAQEYSKRNPDIQMRYVTVGTSEGLSQISRGVGDFAAGESQLTEKQRKEVV
jgi:ABC-type phosphate transport system substrate-binding protein